MSSFIPIVIDQAVPDGTVGVSAIELPAHELEILLDSDVPGYASSHYLHPRVHVTSRVRENRKCWVHFTMDTIDVEGGMGFVVSRPVGTVEANGLTLLHAGQTAVLDLAGIDVVSINCRSYGEPTSIFGTRVLGAYVHIEDFFGTEQPSESTCPPLEHEFLVRDLSPNVPRVTAENININPDTNHIEFDLVNVGACKVSIDILNNYLFTVDGERVNDPGYADYASISIGLNPGERFSFSGGHTYWKFSPVEGATHTVCLYGDPTDIVTIVTPYDGAVTRPVVLLTKR